MNASARAQYDIQDPYNDSRARPHTNAWDSEYKKGSKVAELWAYQLEDWPNRAFFMRDFHIHTKPRQQGDGSWWVRGILFHNPGRIVLDARFDDLTQPATEIHFRNIEYLRRQSAEIRRTVDCAFTQLQTDTQMDDATRAATCQSLLRDLAEFGCYGNQAEVHALSRRLLDYLKKNYRRSNPVRNLLPKSV